jgi:hypothetical protein
VRQISEHGPDAWMTRLPFGANTVRGFAVAGVLLAGGVQAAHEGITVLNHQFK